MAHTKREVWEKAQDYHLDDAISKISEAFGKGAIDGVMVDGPDGIFTTDDRLLFEPDRVRPGHRIDKKEIKQVRNVEKSHLK